MTFTLTTLNKTGDTMNDELEIDLYSQPIYQTASMYEMSDSEESAAESLDCENLYALPV